MQLRSSVWSQEKNKLCVVLAIPGGQSKQWQWGQGVKEKKPVGLASASGKTVLHPVVS